jgi:hypothetical protein
MADLVGPAIPVVIITGDPNLLALPGPCTPITLLAGAGPTYDGPAMPIMQVVARPVLAGDHTPVRVVTGRPVLPGKAIPVA